MSYPSGLAKWLEKCCGVGVGAVLASVSPQHNWVSWPGPQVRFACPSIARPCGDTEPVEPHAGDNAPQQHTLHQGRLAGLGRERCWYIYAACRPRGLSHGQQGTSATHFIVKIQRYLTKAKGNEMYCLGDLRYSLSSLYSLSPDSLPKPFLCMVLSNKGLVSVQCKHV